MQNPSNLNLRFFVRKGFLISVAYLIVMTGCKEISNNKSSENEAGFIENSLAFTSKDSIKAKGLISAETAKMLLNTRVDIKLIEVSKEEKYAAGHIPEAIHIWRPDYESKGKYDYGGMHASRKEMENLLSEKGVNSEDLILIYDTKGSCDALRFAFLLKMYGHSNWRVINGGKAAWKAANFELTKELPKPTKRKDFKFFTKKNESRLATIENVKAAIKNPEIILLDTRELEEYLGKPYISKGKLYPYKKGAFAAGCIPSAIHLNWSDAVELYDDHRFKCLKDQKYNFEKVGVMPDKEIIVYCQSGVRSAHTAFILTEILNYPNVRNYDGSWIEWSYFNKEKGSVDIQKHTSEEEHARLFAKLEKQLNL